MTSVKPDRYLGVTIEKYVTAPFVAAAILAAGAGTASSASADAGPKAPNFRMHTTPSQPYGTVLSHIGINERQSPSTDSAIIGSLGHGALVGLRCMAKAQEVEGNRFWFRLRDRDAWIPARYVKGTGHVEWCEEPDGGTSSKGEADDASDKGADDASGRGGDDASGRGRDDASGRGGGGVSDKGADDASGRGSGGVSDKGADGTSGRGSGGVSDKGADDASGRGSGGVSDKGADGTSGRGTDATSRKRADGTSGRGGDGISDKGADATSSRGTDGTSRKRTDGTSGKRAVERQASDDEWDVTY